MSHHFRKKSYLKQLLKKFLDDMEPIKNKEYRDAHLEDLIDHYWGSLSHISNLVKASEIKAGLILSFYGILLNFVYQSVTTWLDASISSVLWYVLFSTWITTTIISIFFCVRCFMPRIEGDYDDNVLFFGDITTKFGTIKEFSRTFYRVSIDEEKLFQQMGEQIYINAKIAGWKFDNVKKAIRFLAISLVMLAMVLVYYSVFVLSFT